ncbi:MAG: hypothetical protein WC607_02040 [Candidatus Micrarchaeia archaeon]
MKDSVNKLGPWAFLIGLALAVLAGFFATADTTIVLVLAVLGIIVGFLNVSDKETVPFLVSAIAFMMAASSLNIVFAILPYMESMSNVMSLAGVFIAPAAAIVAIKAIYDISKDK